MLKSKDDENRNRELKHLINSIDKKKLPLHIAVIMDGNGRWAKKRNLPRILGHRRGVETVDKIVTLCRELGIKAITLYSFSEENWNRPALEITALMAILKKYLKKELIRMKRENIRFNTIGNIDKIPKDIQKILNDVKEETKDNNGMVLTLALSYGSRDEIIEAVKGISKLVHEGKCNIADIDQKLFEEYLFTRDLPEVDLLIRTSGEMRISNFLLWQIAYTELYFTDTLWPDFKEEDMLHAIIDYQKRNRRYGLTQEQIDK